MATKIISRSDRRASLDAAKEHIHVQGEVVYAANLLHEAFYHLFAVALSLERPDKFGAEIKFHDHALAIWHVIQSDSAQRDMAFVAMTTVPTKLNLKPAIERLKWAKGIAARLTQYRNIVAHSPVMFSGHLKGRKIKMFPNFGGHGSRPQHRERLAMIQGIRLWRALRDDLLDLAGYVDAIRLKIQGLNVASTGAELMNAPASWPDRPRLRSLSHLDRIEKAKDRTTTFLKRQRQRKPSRA